MKNVIDAEFIAQKYEWSLHAFGREQRTEGIVAHIRAELEEVLAKPTDPMEWADIILLAIDGASRAGICPAVIVAAVIEKDRINQARKWPAKHPAADEPSFHERE